MKDSYNKSMKMHKRYFVIIIGILILSLFVTSSSLVPIEGSSQVMLEKMIEESSAEKNSDIKYIPASVLSELEYQIQLEIHAYAKTHYNYTHSKSIYKPPC